MEKKHDIKNIKEVLALMFAVAGPIIRETQKDGFQFTDLLSFIGDKHFQECILPAMTDIGKIPEEIKDFEWSESAELVAFIVSEIQKMFISMY